MAKNWDRDQLILAMNLYCRLPFGRFHQSNPDVIELADLIDRTASAVAMKLCNLASLDPYHAERGVKGLSAASNLDRAVWQEFHKDWETLAAESETLRERSMQSKDIDISTSFGFTGETETRQVQKVRLAQRFFRNAVLVSYENRCCVTGMAIQTLLIASHIAPWSKYPERRADPRNGLCFNALFDKAFDRGLMTLDEDFRIVYSKQIREAATDQAIRQHFRPYEGREITLPSRFRPSQGLLEIHREESFIG